MRLNPSEPHDDARARITAQWEAQERATEDRILKRLAASPEGRLRLANALDDGREVSRGIRQAREVFPFVA